MVMQIKLIVVVVSCNVTVESPITQQVGENVHIMAQVFPNYDTVTLTNNCILRCRKQENGLYGILALRAKTMTIDSSSLIWTNGQGNFLNDK